MGDIIMLLSIAISLILLLYIVCIISLKLIGEAGEVFKQLAFNVIQVRAAWVTHLGDEQKQVLALEQTEYEMAHNRKKAQLMLIEQRKRLRKRLLDVSEPDQGITISNRGPSY